MQDDEQEKVQQMGNLNELGALGLALPTPAYLFGAILFGIIGLAAYRYGKKTSRPTSKWLGVGLMVYPYAVTQTWVLYLVGIGLCIGLYAFRE
ncbi:MAG TPA: hypothetical protein VJ698_12310 [Noviherbaspirillum sp.]|uniref:hypothetical protein n=1 Tax=Noviherbaspirillum sp. TaxID=1926288 RepID=UPI002B48E765|nr:hypothetical protein [Noviherbaspirillum sp.]HJV86248.1 hypothetical protein [Noviherbaspirillum sp.]